MLSLIDLRDLLNGCIEGNPNAKNLDVFVAIDFGDGFSRIYEIDQIDATQSEDPVLLVKAYRQ